MSGGADRPSPDSRPRVVVFDLDGTLCDYATSRQHARAAIQRLLDDWNVETALFWSRYAEAQARLLVLLEAKVISRDEYELRRLHDALPSAVRQRDHLATRLRDEYRTTILATLRPHAGAREVLQQARHGSVTAVLTNGTSVAQRAKLARMCVPPSAQPALFVSEEIGVAKPDRGAFEHVLRTFRVRPDDAMMVGDSIKNDLLPSLNLGMRTVLFVPEGEVPTEWHGPAVAHLSDLLKLL